MKFLLLFIFFSYSYCLDDSQTSENYWLGQISSGWQRGYDDADSDPIVRPCSVRHLDCIRRFFAHNSLCSPVHGPAPDPYIIKNFAIDLPHCNITLTLVDAHIKGLNSGKIQEFYFNKKTDTLVLEVEFDLLVLDTPLTIATYHLKGKEPIELKDDSIIEFKRISLTLVIRNFSDLYNAKPNVYTYFSDTKPPLRVGVAITDTKDPTLIRMNKKWMDEIALSAQEGFIVQGPLYMSAFLNTMICDFRTL